MKLLSIRSLLSASILIAGLGGAVSSHRVFAQSAISEGALTLVPDQQIIGYIGKTPIRGAFLNEQYRFYEWVYGHPFPISTFYEEAMVTKSMILDQLVPQTAVKRGIKISSAQVSQEIKQFEQTLAKQVYHGSIQALDQQQKSLHLSSAVIRQFIADSLLDSRFEASLGKPVTQKQIQAYYAAHQTQFTYVTLNQVVVPTEQLAQKVIQLSNQGDAIEVLAQKFSTDTATKYQGGLYTDVQVSSLVQSVAQTVMKLPIGEISSPIHSKYGYHIIRVDMRVTQPFPAVAISIGQYLLQQRQQSAFNQWVQNLHETYPIRFVIA